MVFFKPLTTMELQVVLNRVSQLLIDHGDDSDRFFAISKENRFFIIYLLIKEHSKK